MKKANKRQITVQTFLRRHGFSDLANLYAFDLAALKRQALFVIALRGGDRLIDKALGAVGVRTDKGQKIIFK